MRRLIHLTLFTGACSVAVAGTAQAQTVIDTPAQAASVQAPFALSGWAAYPAAPTGTGIDHVAVWATPVNGSAQFWGYATYGGSRPDVGTALGDARFTPSGYTLLVSGHAPDTYHVIVYAHIAGTSNYQVAERDVTIQPTPLLTVNGPAVGGSETSPFTIWGWAFDGASPSGVGIDAVHIYAYPNPGSGAAVIGPGSATLGQHRPDVGGFFQNPQFNPSGWSLTVGPGTLPAGQYLLIVYAHSTVANAWIASTRIIYVDQPSVTLTIDRGGGGTGGITSNPGGLSCVGGAGTQALPCAASYTQTSQTAVTLTATADTGSVFTGWSGACTGTGLCQVTMNQARHVLATFNTYATTYYHLDTLGSVRAITDSQATPAVIATHTYAPFGEDTAPLTGDPLRFTGKELDAETALQYFGARYYRNRIGRFMSVDPIGGGLVDPQEWNPYAYAKNNPLRFVDPTGLLAQEQKCHDRQQHSNGGTAQTPQIDCGFAISSGVGAGASDSDVARFFLRRPRSDSTGLFGSPERRERHAAFQRIFGGIGQIPINQVVGAGIAAGAAGGVVGAAGAAAAGTAAATQLTVGAVAASTAVLRAYHFTSQAAVQGIKDFGLRPTAYVTPQLLTLSEATRKLALDPTRTYNAIVEIDIAAMRAANFNIPMQSLVGPLHGQPGGGIEMFFSRGIPARFIR